MRAVSHLGTALGLVRFASSLKPFLREPISIASAKIIIRDGMRQRGSRFLDKVQRAIFAHPASPYLKLFRAAGCDFSDVTRLVEQEGIEGTLGHLVRAGIYVTYEEFKGRAPAVRGSQTFHFRDTDFDNPLIAAHYYSGSGGTQGRPTLAKGTLAHTAQSAPHWAVWFAAHGWLENPLVLWNPSYPAIASRHLMCVKFGQRFIRWFAPVSSAPLGARVLTLAFHTLVRRAAGFPRPEFVAAGEEWRIGEYLAGLVREGLRPCVNAAPSAAVRLCLAMGARGVDLHDVTFLLGAEPLTPARKRTIEAAGARAVPTYGFTEGGNVGSQCPSPSAVDDIHISLDAYAVIQRSRCLPSGETVDALLLTALRPAAPKIMLNTEIGDHAVLESRRCGCLFGELGYSEHLHTIRSFEKPPERGSRLSEPICFACSRRFSRAGSGEAWAITSWSRKRMAAASLAIGFG